MLKGTTHSTQTRAKISQNTRLAMKKPSIRKKTSKTWFKTGQSSWNKGLSIHLSPASEWKQGEHVGHESFGWKGGVQKPKNDCVHLWGGSGVRLRRPKQVFETFYNIKIPKGMVVYHLNGDRNDDRPENLMICTRATLLWINRNKEKVKK